jgi:recombination protein RecA
VRKEIQSLVNKLNKDFGFNAVVSATELEEAQFRIPTGSISLDIALGGGIPAGRMINIGGRYSSFKSGVSYHIIANAQKMFRDKILWDKYSTKDNKVYKWTVSNSGIPFTAGLIQSETHSYTNQWAEGIGINVNDLLFARPESMEEALEIGLAMQESGEVELIVYDSYNAMQPKKITDTELGDNPQMGVKAQLFGRYNGSYQGLNNKASREGRLPTTIIALTQIREKIGGYGNPETISGGNSNKHTNSVDIRLRQSDIITIGSGENKIPIGQTIKFKIEKNKTWKPFQTGEFDFYFSEGGPVAPGCIDNVKELIIEAMMYNVIERSGAWFYYGGKQIAQGKEKAIELLRKEKGMFDEIRGKTLKLALNYDNDIERPNVFGEEEIEEEDIPAIPVKKQRKVVKR